MKRLLYLLAILSIVVASPSDSLGGIRVGAAEVEITPPVGFEIQHYYRISEGVHDPLFARCLYLQDDAGQEIALVCLDLIMGDFETCDQLRSEIKSKTEVPHSLIHFSHNHSSVALGPRGRSRVSNDDQSRWNDATLDAILQLVRTAISRAEPVSLRVGRADANVGFNRRLVNEQGHVYMGVNRDGPRVPWVNVLIAESTKSGDPISVLFETAAHPVIVPHTTKKISADFPGAAVRLLKEKLGKDVVAMFGQGCAGNINGFPLRSSYENAVRRGQELGASVLRAIHDSQPINSDRLSIKFARSALPSHPFPPLEKIDQWTAENQDHDDRLRRLAELRRQVERGLEPPARRLDVYSVTLGNEWCLTSLPHEMFCQYELWIDEHAPFKRTMTLGYTNGYQGYVAVDAAWKLREKGGYEAASLPNWGGQVHTQHFGPPAVGSEKIIKDTIASLWPTSKNASSDHRSQAECIAALRSLRAHVFLRKGKVVEVSANRTRITDKQLECVSKFLDLTDLSLEMTPISDQGIKHLLQLQRLEWLNLYRCPVGDESLRMLKGLKSLQHLPVGESHVTDQGLRHLAEMPQLVYLGLRGTAVSDRGLVHLRRLDNLAGLHLGETGVTDAGLANLCDMRKLQRLWLNDTAITDAAIEHLTGLRTLTELHLAGTQVSAEGVKRLRRALPLCEVELK